MNRITLTESVHKNEQGREYVQFKPVLVTDCLAQGELSFAVWHAWADEPETWDEIKKSAISAAKDALSCISREVDAPMPTVIRKVGRWDTDRQAFEISTEGQQ